MGVVSPSLRVHYLAFPLISYLLSHCFRVWQIEWKRFRGNFLGAAWGMNLNFYLVNWNTCCPPVCRGGLGIKKLFLFNQVFLGKWRYEFEDTVLWRQVIDLKYGSNGEYWFLGEVRGHIGSDCRSILEEDGTNLCRSLARMLEMVLKLGFRIMCSQGQGETILKERFPSLLL